MESLDLGA